MQPKLLFIDDDVATCDVVHLALTKSGYDVTCVNAGADALVALERDEFDAVISDLNMPGMTGLELCRRAHAIKPALPIVVITAFGSMESAVAAIRAGAYDFISKPIQMPELQLTLTRALEHWRLTQENQRLREAVASQQSPADIIGDSPPMREVYTLLRRLGDQETTILITGESGTGKELIAREVHRTSPRSNGPLVAFNCAAVPEAMLESELFGHMRGAFTDAKANHKGLFQQANGGTLFLDEIGEMPLSTQVKLLRALQERTVRPVGSEREVPFDARVLSATSRDLESDVAEQRFREDLYYRINVIRVHMPPLRARGRDVLLIAEHFIRVFAKRLSRQVSALTPPAAAKLLEYPWPGNVRELQNCMERSVVLSQSDQIALDDLPKHIRDHQATHFVLPLENPLELLSLDEVEKRYILQVLEAVSGSKTQAATSLGLDRRTLYRKLKLYGVA